MERNNPLSMRTANPVLQENDVQTGNEPALPVVESGWEPVLREAKAAKIPVILTDRAVDSKDTSLYVTYEVDTERRTAELRAIDPALPPTPATDASSHSTGPPCSRRSKVRWHGWP